MAKPNYQFEKRQRELEKKKKKAEKASRKAPPPAASPDEDTGPAGEPGAPAPAGGSSD
jgi:hypothetical protein